MKNASPMLLLAKFSPEWLLLLGVVMLTVILLRITYRRLGRRRRAGDADSPIVHVPRSDQPRSGAYHDSATLLDRQEIELYELSRELTGRLDSKIVVLQQLIIQSDAKIAQLRQLLSELDEKQ